LSVIIVSYNVRTLLERCVASVAEADEVIVVDNDSTDGSAAVIEAEHRGATLVRMGANRGFSAAVNAGVERASGDALLLLNSDAEVPPGALAEIRRTFERVPDAAVVGFRQQDSDGNFQWCWGPELSLPGELVRRWLQRRLDAGSRWAARALDRWASRIRPVDWVSGASMLIRRPIFDEVGGFDDGYFLYFEDIDFCRRVRRAGGRVYIDPTVTVVHVRGASTDTAPAIAARAYRDSQRRYWSRHHGPISRTIVDWYVRLRTRGGS
jgi:GT2 family glycosyltransferase